MQNLDLEFMWKDDNSATENCPALYRVRNAEVDGYVVQGKGLDPATRAQLRQLADDESAVFVPANVLDRLRELG